MAEIIVGLLKLHQSGLLHADLKLENVMKDFDGHIKIIDFGGAQKLKDIHHKPRNCLIGTPEYFAPEAINGIIRYMLKI